MTGKELGARIQARRKRLKIPQRVLADKLGISREAYSKKELGINAITTDDLVIIAEVLDVDAGELLKMGRPEEEDGDVSAQIKALLLRMVKEDKAVVYEVAAAIQRQREHTRPR